MKWDPLYTFRKYEPEMLIFFWGTGSGVDFKDILAAHYKQVSPISFRGAVFMRKDKL
jgi:hypothetical protein